MGGEGSGERWDRSTKDLTEYYLTIDVRRLQRGGLLTPGGSFRWKWTAAEETVASVEVTVDADRIKLSYRTRDDASGEGTDMAYLVRLEWTSCHFGGVRPWFLCPATGCGRRVAILHGGPIFACRHCHQLAYRCTRESPADRAARRVDRVRARLGWQPGFWSPRGQKKPWMHWRTFRKLTAKHDAAAAKAMSGLMRQIQGLSRLRNRNL